MYIHFSIDDVFGCFNWLNKVKSQSIYESFVFDSLKKIHSKYGIEITLYCLCTDGNNSLSDIPDIWKDEIYSERSWLHFGFHGFMPGSNYTNENAEIVKKQYDYFANQIYRIAGVTEPAKTLRLHYYSGNKEIIEMLYEKGIRTLLCADDSRISYGLESEQNNTVLKNGMYFDSCSGIKFLHTNFRVEKLEIVDLRDIEKMVKEEQLIFFTHETLLKDSKIVDKIYQILDFVTYMSR